MDAKSVSISPNVSVQASLHEESSTGQVSGSKHPRNGGPSGSGSVKRRKVNMACLYCRRSHMHCDENRPCARCIKRDIGHLCHDEPKQPAAQQWQPGSSSTEPPSPMVTSGTFPQGLSAPTQNSFMGTGPGPTHMSMPTTTTSSMNTYAPARQVSQSPQFPDLKNNASINPPTSSMWPELPSVELDPSMFADVGAGNEFSVLSDFLENLDRNSYFTGSGSTTNPPMTSMSQAAQSIQSQSNPSTSTFTTPIFSQLAVNSPEQSLTSTYPLPSSSAENPPSQAGTSHAHTHVDPLPPKNKTERFLLTAADQESGTRDERLASVIRAKYEAGLLKPYNYVKGYSRLGRWMEQNVSSESRQAILQPISVLRPKFRGVAQRLTDIDLVYVEEAFERLLLDYDRVFSAMGIPACLWRRTGEIYKANRPFADLIGVDVSKFRDGRLCIYELMSEDSAVNYWEQYGHVAFDSTQKAVLTSCVLRLKPKLPGLQPALTMKNTGVTNAEPEEEDFVSCCFSFTIRRDNWGIPSMIVGNFIKC
ncbi:hypothetical protein FRB94_010971 [Tulasnella sp. JGI-2019a]|nr:hypothetical protein FRB94_010971 [Tulasnella sp. JGI-2019a]